MSQLYNGEYYVQDVDLGPCDCPGTPHDHDWVRVRCQFTAREIVALQGSIGRMDDSDEADESMIDSVISQALVPYVTEWNLLDDDGEVCELSADNMARLKSGTLLAMVRGVGAAIVASEQVPNPSGVPSEAPRRATRRWIYSGYGARCPTSGDL